MGFVRRTKYGLAAVAAAWLMWSGLQARGQDLAWGRRSCPPAPCPAPEEKPKEGAPVIPPPPPSETPPSEPSLAPERAAAFEGETVALATPNMLGDSLSSTALRCVPFQRTTFVPQTVTVTVQPPFCISVFSGITTIIPMTGGKCPRGFAPVRGSGSS